MSNNTRGYLMFVLKIVMRNLPTGSNPQMWTTNMHRMDSDPNYATEDNKQTTAVGKHIRSLFANHFSVYKAGVSTVRLFSGQSHLMDWLVACVGYSEALLDRITWFPHGSTPQDIWIFTQTYIRLFTTQFQMVADSRIKFLSTCHVLGMNPICKTRIFGPSSVTGWLVLFVVKTNICLSEDQFKPGDSVQWG